MSEDEVTTPTGGHRVTCTRRPLTTWPDCPCPDCEIVKRRARKRHAAGLLPPSRSDEAWAVIDRLTTAGWTPLAIATAAGLPLSTIVNALRDAATGHRSTWSRLIAERIIRHGSPTAGYVGSLGTRRRLQALTVIGWDLAEIADATGLGVMTLSKIRAGVTARVSPRVAAAVDTTYRAWCMRPGPSGDAARRGVERGWVSPLAWDDIDDPADHPHSVRREATA